MSDPTPLPPCCVLAVCWLCVVRRWDDDVVFKNQSRDEPTLKKRFVNDVTRSDFHRSFMKKYIK